MTDEQSRREIVVALAAVLGEIAGGASLLDVPTMLRKVAALAPALEHPAEPAQPSSAASPGTALALRPSDSATTLESTASRAAGKGARITRGQDAKTAGRLFELWRSMGHDGARPTPERMGAIMARLRDGYTEEEIGRAIVNVNGSRWHQGDNDRGRRYDDLTMICRNATKLEQYRDMTNADETAVLERIAKATTEPKPATAALPRESEAERNLRAEARRAMKEGRVKDYELINAEIAKLKAS